MKDGSSPGLDRREFVGRCAAITLTAMLTGCASLVVRHVTPVNGVIELALQQYPELSQPGGSLKILPSGSTEQIYVLVLNDGSIAALSPICTHLACTVEVQADLLVCPCHGSTYDRSGQVLRGPAARALKQYRVGRLANDVISIDLRS